MPSTAGGTEMTRKKRLTRPNVIIAALTIGLALSLGLSFLQNLFFFEEQCYWINDQWFCGNQDRVIRQFLAENRILSSKNQQLLQENHQLKVTAEAIAINSEARLVLLLRMLPGKAWSPEDRRAILLIVGFLDSLCHPKTTGPPEKGIPPIVPPSKNTEKYDCSI